MERQSLPSHSLSSINKLTPLTDRSQTDHDVLASSCIQEKCVNNEISMTPNTTAHSASPGAAPELLTAPVILHGQVCGTGKKNAVGSGVACSVFIELPSKLLDVFLTRKTFVLLQCLDSLSSCGRTCFPFWCNAGGLNLGSYGALPLSP